MNKKNIVAIENILKCLNELEILCNGRDANYFYDGYEMPILCDLVNQIEINLARINTKMKRKYANVNWDIIECYKELDGDYKVLKMGKVWELANIVLKKELKRDLSNILKKELPIYYTNYCNQKHERFLKNKKFINIY